MQCHYCGRTTINYPMFVIMKETKPKGQPNRKRAVGYCCEQCEDTGKPILLKYVEPVPMPTLDDVIRRSGFSEKALLVAAHKLESDDYEFAAQYHHCSLIAKNIKGSLHETLIKLAAIRLGRALIRTY